MPPSAVQTKNPAYIVAEIPEPIRSGVQLLRDALRTRTASLPVEMTLAGSSGVGPIPAGIETAYLEQCLEHVLVKCRAFEASFSAICRFPGTSTIYLEPADPTPFVQIHHLLRASGIQFSTCPWPYTPHCTLRAGDMLTEEAVSAILSQEFPRESFRITTLSVYELDASWPGYRLLCRRGLRG